MRRGATLIFFLLWLSLLGLPGGAAALDVVVVKSAGVKPYNDAVAGFKNAVGGRVVEIDLVEVGRQGAIERIRSLAPDAVVAIGSDAFQQVRSIRDLPVFYTMLLSSEQLDGAPKNISGVSMEISAELYIANMVELFPSARRFGLVFDPRLSAEFVREARQAARSRGVELVAVEATSPREVPSLIDGMRDRIDVLWMLPDSTVTNAETVNYMLLVSFQHRIPLFTFSEKYVEMGALAALTVNPYDLGAQTAEIARSVLSGQSGKGPLRVGARKAVLSVNKKVAGKLGVKIKYEAVTNGEGRFLP